MIPTVVVPPAIEPVSWAEAQEWIHALDSEETLVEGLISAAREVAEWKKGYTFYEQTLEVAYRGWPAEGWIMLPRATPLISVASVKYIDSDGAEQTLPSNQYRVNTMGIPGGLVFVESWSRPSVDYYAPNPVVIRYVAGLNTSPLQPVNQSIRLAMRLMVAHWYKNREAVVVGQSASVSAMDLPMGVETLLGVDQAIFAF